MKSNTSVQSTGRAACRVLAQKVSLPHCFFLEKGTAIGGDEDASVAKESLRSRHTTLGITAQAAAKHPTVLRQTTIGLSSSPGGSPRSTGSAHSAESASRVTAGLGGWKEGGGEAHTRSEAAKSVGTKPVSLLKQKSESCVRQPKTDASKGQPGQVWVGVAGRRTFVMPSMRHEAAGQGSKLKSTGSDGSPTREGEGASATAATPRDERKGAHQAPTTRVSMLEKGGGNGGERLVRRPQRYDKIKMKSPVNVKKNKVSILNRAKTPVHQSTNGNNSSTTGADNTITENECSENVNAAAGSVPQALKGKLLARGAIGAVSVAQRVVSGFRGEPYWASGSSRRRRWV